MIKIHEGETSSSEPFGTVRNYIDTAMETNSAEPFGTVRNYIDVAIYK